VRRAPTLATKCNNPPVIGQCTDRLYSGHLYDRSQPLTPTQHGHPVVRKRIDYTGPSLEKKRRVLRNSRPCYEDCSILAGLIG